jgi:hypothetical protein
MFKYVHSRLYIFLYCSVMQIIAPLLKLCLHNNRCLFFRRLKINHESNEFILDSGTVANNDGHLINMGKFYFEDVQF